MTTTEERIAKELQIHVFNRKFGDDDRIKEYKAYHETGQTFSFQAVCDACKKNPDYIYEDPELWQLVEGKIKRLRDRIRNDSAKLSKSAARLGCAEGEIDEKIINRIARRIEDDNAQDCIIEFPEFWFPF